MSTPLDLKHRIALLDAEHEGHVAGEQRMIRVLAGHVSRQWRYVDALSGAPEADTARLEAFSAERALIALADSMLRSHMADDGIWHCYAEDRPSDPSAYVRMAQAILYGRGRPAHADDPAARERLWAEIAGFYFAH